MSRFAMPGIYLLNLLILLLNIYSWAFVIQAILSWAFLPSTNSLVRFFRFITEPVLNPCRALLYRILPRRSIWQRLDFSPLLALLLIQLVIYLIQRFAGI